jgi:hypothetical protein
VNSNFYQKTKLFFMKKIVFLIFLSLFLINFFILAKAAPFLYDPKPVNGTYIYGRDTDEFAISIVESDFNESSAKVFVRVKDPTSVWQSISLNCVNSTLQDWYCNTTIPGLESLLADGKILLYYFTASDNQGASSSNGTQENPLQVLVDRSGPVINFTNIQNQSYVSNNKQVEVKITDLYSGVAPDAQYMVGNESWNSTWQLLQVLGNDTYKTNYDISQFENNSTIILYINASDVVGNKNVTKLDLLVDNELPDFTIASPTQSEVYGNVNLTLTVSDSYSGIDSAYFFIGNNSQTLSCDNGICSSFFDSTLVSDGNYTTSFKVFDKAGNFLEKTMELSVSNTIPVIYLITLQNSSYISGKYNISFSVGNVRELRSATIAWSNLTFSSGVNYLTCENFICNYTLDTLSLKEGEYQIEITATNEAGFEVSKTIVVIVDNTEPTLSLGIPIPEEVNGTFVFNIIAIDSVGLDKNSAEVSLDSVENEVGCTEFVAGKKLVCSSTFNTSEFSDGEYNLTFKIKDLAGNQNTLVEKIKIKNTPFTTENLPEEQKNETEQGGTTAQPASIPQTFQDIVQNLVKSATENWYIIPIIIFIVTFLIGAISYKIKQGKKQKPSRQKSLKEMIIEERDKLNFSHNFFISAMNEDNIDAAKSKLINALTYLNSLRIDNFVVSRLEEIIKNLTPKQAFYVQNVVAYLRSRKPHAFYIEKLKEKITNLLGLDSLEEIRENSKEARQLYQEFLSLMDKENSIALEISELLKKQQK